MPSAPSLEGGGLCTNQGFGTQPSGLWIQTGFSATLPRPNNFGSEVGLPSVSRFIFSESENHGECYIVIIHTAVADPGFRFQTPPLRLWPRPLFPESAEFLGMPSVPS